MGKSQNPPCIKCGQPTGHASGKCKPCRYEKCEKCGKEFYATIQSGKLCSNCMKPKAKIYDI